MFPDFDFILNSAVALGIVFLPVELYVISIIRPLKVFLKNPSALIGDFAKKLRMGFLGQKGVEAREVIGLMDNLSGEDPVKGILATAGAEFARDQWGPKAAQRVEGMLSMIPLNLTQTLWVNLPAIAEKVGNAMGKGAEAKSLAEQLRLLGKITPIEQAK